MIKDRSKPEINNGFKKKLAIIYISRGWPVIPLYEADRNGCACGLTNCPSPGKHPRIKNGIKGCSIDHTIVEHWWTQWPNANIGIATGSCSGIVVLDIDPANGGDLSLKTLIVEHGELTTAKAYSGGNGLHFYFKIPKDVYLKNRVNIKPGIDLRGENGYIVAAPSTHISGGQYVWHDSALHAIEELPAWLLSLLKDSNNSTTQNDLVSNNEYIGPGSRNTFLASIAGVGNKFKLKHNEIKNMLNLINKNYCSPALSVEEVQKISESISKYDAQNQNNMEWGELKDFPNREADCLPKMDLDFIPSRLKKWIEDISNRMQVPIELIAIPAIVALGSLIGRKIRIYPKQKDTWLVTPNLWGAVVARPGTLKTPAIAEALAPLEKIINREHQDFEKKLSLWSTKKIILHATEEAVKNQITVAIDQQNKEHLDLLQNQLNTIRSEIEAAKPICKRFKTNDATVEKIVEILTENPNGLMILRDELSGWLETLNKAGREGERQFFLEAWSAKGSYTIDRIGRGTTHVSSLCLSVFGAIQPDKLNALLTTPLKNNDDGLLQRFQLLVSPSIKKDWTNHDIEPDQASASIAYDIFSKIADYHPISSEFDGLRFSQDAQVLFDTWRANLESVLRSDSIDHIHYEAHISKYRSMIPSLALIFSITESDSIPDSVSEEALKLALKWYAYLNEHAKYIYQANNAEDLLAASKLAEKIQKKKIKNGMSIRSILRNCWQGLKTADQLDQALEDLENLNWIKVLEEKKSIGRSSKRIYLHPQLLLSV